MRNVALSSIRQSPCLSRSRRTIFALAGFQIVAFSTIRIGIPLFTSKIQHRAAKTSSKVQSGDLSQRSLVPEKSPLGSDDGGPAYPTVVQQARDNMQKFENCILLTRVGSFYEAC